MKKGLVCLVVVSVLALAGGARAADLGIITGSEKGTYYQFGLNLQRLARMRNVDLSVFTSRGSIENVDAVYQRPGVQMGIVQSDVLAFLTRVQSDPVLKRIARKTRMVFPLYNEEVHLLGRRDIVDFDDLADRRVAIGREGSGTYLTARLLFKVSEVTPREMVPIDTDEALAELKAGRIDAMFYVAGYPVKLFVDGVGEADGLKLVPIANKSVLEFYPGADVPGGTYVWQPAPVRTVAVKSVLVSFDFKRRDCDAIGRFALLVSENLPWLAQNGHPKWKAVDIAYPLKGWEQYECVQRYLRGTSPAMAKPKTSTSALMEAVKDLLGD